MQLPDHVTVTPTSVAAIAARHGLVVPHYEVVPQVGIINALYRLGDTAVLRVPRNHPGHIAQTRVEAIAAPLARAAGLRTPRLLAFDDACDLLPVPYTIMEWVPGRALGVLDLEPVETVDAWRALGRDLALLHTRVRKDGPAGALRTATALPDPRTLVEDRAHDGWFTALEARWLARWLERLAPAATVPVPPRFLHLDVQATNVLLRSDSLAYAALLDWGNAGWGDAAWDFFGIPLRAVPQVLAGHREVAPLDADESAEARILWRHLQMVLAILPRGPTPGLSWGERPLAWLLEVARFFFDAPHGRWRELAP